MLSEIINKVSLFHLLYQIDQDLARQKQQEGCPHCGGPLHYSNYLRKPRGSRQNIPNEYLVRLSLCCGREECRKRTIPPSCRFMGRRVYWGCVILVVMTLKQARPSGSATNSLMRQFGISRNTLLRWFAYFREVFPSSAKWQMLRGRVSTSVENVRLPGSLLEHFFAQFGEGEAGLAACLQFLA